MRVVYFFILLFLIGCNSSRYLVSNTGFPKAPDYKYIKNWASSPKKEIPLPLNYVDSLEDFKSKVDVFYIYPTVYYSGYDGNFWNSNPEDLDHINRVNTLTLHNQASVFSGISNVYAPYYRQLFYDGLYYHISNEILTKIALKIGAIKVIILKHMQSDLCFYCRFGSGGHGKKSELPPMP